LHSLIDIGVSWTVARGRKREAVRREFAEDSDDDADDAMAVVVPASFGYRSICTSEPRE
jgi:hypothetical protein